MNKCHWCQREKPNADLAMWWTMKRVDGEVEGYNVHLACRTFECATRAEAMCGYSSAVLAGDVSLDALEIPEQAKRVLESYDWHPDQLSTVKKYCKAAFASRSAKKRASDRWDEDDPVGVKRQRLVKWLMMRPRCVPLEEAKLIASRKYR